MNSLLPRLCAVAVGIVLLTSAYYRTSSASVMTEAANRFLASLTAGQRAKATFHSPTPSGPTGSMSRLNARDCPCAIWVPSSAIWPAPC